MIQITEITSDPRQKLEITLENNETFLLQLEYSSQQQSWFMNINYNDFIINSFKLIISPNILRQFRNNLPFGIAISTTDQSEPIFVDDFSSQRVNFFVLSEQEVADVEDTFYTRS